MCSPLTSCAACGCEHGLGGGGGETISVNPPPFPPPHPILDLLSTRACKFPHLLICLCVKMCDVLEVVVPRVDVSMVVALVSRLSAPQRPQRTRTGPHKHRMPLCVNNKMISNGKCIGNKDIKHSFLLLFRQLTLLNNFNRWACACPPHRHRHRHHHLHLHHQTHLLPFFLLIIFSSPHSLYYYFLQLTR